MKRGQANQLLLIAAILWGAGNVAQQTILEHIGPFLAVGLRCAIACLVILPFAFAANTMTRTREMTEDRSGILAILSFTIAITVQQIGFAYTTVTNAGFIVNTTAVATPLLAWVLLRRRPESKIWPAAALSFFGAALLSGGSLGGINLGDVLCFISAIFFSLWMIYLGEFVTRNGNAVQLTLAQFSLAGFICISLSFLLETISFDSIEAALPELLTLGVFSTGVAFLLQSFAQKYTSAGEAAVITSGEAVFGAVGAAIYLGERLGVLAGAGAALVLVGVLILQIPSYNLTQRKHRQGPASVPPLDASVLATQPADKAARKYPRAA
ncbi:MAG: DMT family transporter [Aestuariivirga sp.]